jgi:hypothetical protein
MILADRRSELENIRRSIYMEDRIIILAREKQEISRISNPENGNNILILQYRGKTFRFINVSFNISRRKNAQIFCQNLRKKYGKHCILLENNLEYGIWVETNIQQEYEPKTDGASENKAKLDRKNPRKVTSSRPISLTQGCLLIAQIIMDDIEDLMGTNKKIAFQEELTKIFKQCLLPGAESSEPINYLLRIDPLEVNDLPSWQEKHLEKLFPKLGRLGKKYFGNTSFVERTIDTLKSLPIYQQPQMMNCCMQFVLMSKI